MKRTHPSLYFALRGQGHPPRKAFEIVSLTSQPYHRHIERMRRIAKLLNPKPKAAQ